jgi:acyl dehydratase
MYARFTKPVIHGDTLVISIWSESLGARFQTATQDGTVVLDRGRFTHRKEA